MVRGCQGQVQEFSIGSQIRVDRYRVSGFWTEIVEEFCNTLGAGVWVCAEWICERRVSPKV